MYEIPSLLFRQLLSLIDWLKCIDPNACRQVLFPLISRNSIPIDIQDHPEAVYLKNPKLHQLIEEFMLANRSVATFMKLKA